MGTKTATIKWSPFSQKHVDYIRASLSNWFMVAEGAIRSGKTIDHCIIASMYLETCPDKIHLASGSTIANAKMNIGDCNGFGLEHLFRGRCRWGKYEHNEALFIKTKTGTKIVVFAGGGKADSYKKILGNSYGLWIATEINLHYDSKNSETSFIKVSLGRQIASRKPMVLWDLNPCNPNHDIYTNYIDKYRDEGLEGGYCYEHFTIDDNLSVTPERRKQIESTYTIGSVWWRRDIKGERCKPEGLCFPMWEKAIAESPKNIPISDYCLSIDYGTYNAFACLLWAKYGEIWYAIREYYYSGRTEGIQKSDEDYARDIEGWIKDTGLLAEGSRRLKVIIDPSASSFITVLDQRRKYHVIPADNDVADGIRETANALANGYIKICPACDNWQKEAGGYSWDEKNKNEDDRPIKVKDHLMDATRYFVKTMNIVEINMRRLRRR